MGGVREGLYGYPYLKHLTQLCPCNWVKNMEKMNEAVGMNNCLTMSGGNELLVRTSRKQEFWKCIGCILSEVTYGKKVTSFGVIYNFVSGKNPPTKLQIDVRGSTDLNKVCCDLYCPFYCYACHQIILSYTTLFIYWMFI